MAEKDKKKNIVFSEIIDSKINGYALGFSLLLVSTFLLFNSTYLYWPWFTYSVGAVLGILGIGGIGCELDKNKKFKGIGNLALGIIFLGIWLALFVKFNDKPVINFLGMFPLIFGAYGSLRGLFELFYSIWLEITNSQRSVSKISKAVFVFMTQICGLVLTILNILKIFKIV